MKIQLRNYSACCDADAVNKAEGSIRTTAIARSRPGSPESLARGMLPKGFPRNPGELTISARKSGNADRQGRPEASVHGWRSSLTTP